MSEFQIQRLAVEHATALLAFERENRAFFARSVPDRGDEYFSNFADRHAALLAEQAEGVCHFHVLVEDGNAIIGRVNLVDVADGEAELGFRIAHRVTGRGIATRAVEEVCGRAKRVYGLRSLRASTTVSNVSSQSVLSRAGFRPTGHVELDGCPGLSFRRML